ncbi:polysaccharide deacetylase family protein [Shewanella maritima]|uniref:polysaccharide deacetylase family protein n=1 Tax=Shewanella maritima TaxID=2520507 RepID=UPI0037358A2F
MLKNMRLIMCGLFSVLLSLPVQAVVILQYHHVSDSTPKSTSVTPEQFTQQMAYLADNDFTVISLQQAVDAIKAKRHLDAKTIVITFDDGYDSIINNAAPILAKHQFPYTVFVAVEPVDNQYRGMMNWQQINQLVQQGATIANHSWGHEHLIRRLEGETDTQWYQRVEKNLLDTEAAIEKHTGQSVKMLAYPYGEYNTELEAMLTKHDFIGLGQHSGAAGPYSSLTALPRFPMADAYADMNELKVKFASLNMPVLEQSVTDPQLPMGQWRPKLTITLDITDIYPHQLMCFVQGQGAKTPIWSGEDQFTVQADLDLPAGRSRYNCTAPSKTKSGYYWFSQSWVRPRDDGVWVHE